MPVLDDKGVERLWFHILSKLGKKVEVEIGKGLSSNDYTNEEKEKLAKIDINATKTEIDETLSISGYAADAKVSGDALRDMNDKYNDVYQSVSTIDSEFDYLSSKVEDNELNLTKARLDIQSLKDMVGESSVSEQIENATSEIRNIIPVIIYSEEEPTYQEGAIWLKPVK